MTTSAHVITNNSTNVRNPIPSPMKSCFELGSRVSPQLTSRLAARLFCFTHGPRRNTPRELNWLRDAHPFEMECDGRRLAAWSWGNGPTVLLHHGWSGRGGQMGAFVAPLVAAGFSVVAYDAPAHGASPGRFTNGIEMARTIREVSRQLGGLHAVVAHSLGCLATSYALRQPLPIERVVFVSPPADMLTFTHEFAGMLGLSDRAHGLMLEHFERSLGMDWHDFEVERLAETDRRARGRQTPLLVVHDEDDRQVPVHHARRLHEAWQGSRFLQTSRLGHQRILRDEGVVGEVVGFLVAEST